MTQTRTPSKPSLIVGITAFIIGAIFGLVVLGWVVWPVTWQDADPSSLRLSAKQDFLISAIDSYALNPDRELAIQRFDSLGNDSVNVLTAIYQTADSGRIKNVEHFASAVGASDALEVSETTPKNTDENQSKATTNPILVVFLGLGAVILLALFIFGFTRMHRIDVDQKAKQTAKAEDMPADSQFEIASDYLEMQEASDQDFLEDLFEIPSSDLEVPASDLQSVGVALDNENAGSPDWLELESEIDLLVTEENESAVSEKLHASDIAGQSYSEKNVIAEQSVIKPETPDETFAKFSGGLEWLPGMEAEIVEKLEAIGITAPLLLLKKGYSREGRDFISLNTGVGEEELLKWVNMVDLLRINGLTEKDAQTLAAIDIDKLQSLADCDPNVLIENIRQFYEDDFLYAQPSREQVEDWVSQAHSIVNIVEEQ